MRRHKHICRGVSRFILLVIHILILFGLIGTPEAAVYRVMTIDSEATVGSPLVVLQNGSTGTSTIYTSGTSANVSVSGYGYDFVDSNDTNVDLSANKGSQSNFTAQKSGPDLINDTLTEENVGGDFQLDLEVQWTNVDCDETFEELCIRTGTFTGSEDLMIYAWNVSTSDWHFLYNLTMNSWNNVSVTNWLNSGTFTVRFLGGTESSDGSQDNWDIDATLIHIWTEADYQYDYVLKINNTVADSWQIRLKKYSSSGINRLDNCTIHFRNSTNANSTQIVIEKGSFSQTEGQWFNLTSLETIYITMTPKANSTATSNVYIYLEIRTPGTTTYRLYQIAFEIT